MLFLKSMLLMLMVTLHRYLNTSRSKVVPYISAEVIGSATATLAALEAELLELSTLDATTSDSKSSQALLSLLEKTDMAAARLQHDIEATIPIDN